jgi:hypothetical protein
MGSIILTLVIAQLEGRHSYSCVDVSGGLLIKMSLKVGRLCSTHQRQGYMKWLWLIWVSGIASIPFCYKKQFFDLSWSMPS